MSPEKWEMIWKNPDSLSGFSVVRAKKIPDGPKIINFSPLFLFQILQAKSSDRR